MICSPLNVSIAGCAPIRRAHKQNSDIRGAEPERAKRSTSTLQRSEGDGNEGDHNFAMCEVILRHLKSMRQIISLLLLAD